MLYNRYVPQGGGEGAWIILEQGLKRRTLFLIFLSTYFVLVISIALIALSMDEEWDRSFGLSLLYGGTGIAAFGFLFLRGGVAINSLLGKRSRIPKTEDYAKRIEENKSFKSVEQVIWTIVLAAILTAATGYLLLHLG